MGMTPDPAVAALAAALHTYYHNGEGSPDGGHDGSTVFCSEDAAAILAALPPGWCGHADIFTTHQGSCGHLWKYRGEPNDCPVCNEMAGLRIFAEREHAKAHGGGDGLREARLRDLSAVALEAFDPMQPDWPDFGKQVAGLDALRRIVALVQPEEAPHG